MSFKIIIFIILLVTPPYGWVGLFLWLVWHATCEDLKKQKEKAPQAPAAPADPAPAAKVASEPEPELLMAKVNNGRCDLYNCSDGAYVRSLGSDVVQASTGRDYVAIVTQQGYADIYNASTGSYVRRQSSDAVSAQIQGDDIAITDKNGRVNLYNLPNGSYRRTL